MPIDFDVKNLQKNLLEHSLNEIFVFSCDDLRFLFANKGGLQNLGYTLEELKKISPVDIKPEFTKEEFLEIVSPLSRGEVEKLSFKTVHQRKDGSFYNAMIDLQILKERDRNVFVAMVLDVTEQELEATEKETKLILQAKQTEVLNKLLKLNSLYELPLGEKLKQGMEYLFEVPWLKVANKGGVFLVKENVLELEVSVKMGPKIETMCAKVEAGVCLCGRAFEQRETIHASCVDERHENRFEGISAHGHYNVPIISDGVVLGVMVFYLPHGHKRNEAETNFLESCAEVFSQIIKTNEFQENLIREKKRAKEAEEAKSAFLANMSHEIRTPMNGVIGMAELLMDEPISEDVREKVKIIKSSGTSLLALINDILDYSKIEAGKLEFDISKFSFKDLLTEISAVFQIISSKKNINFNLMVSPEVPTYLEGDLMKLKQILQNLINNAVKFTEEGEVGLELSVLERDGDLCIIEFKITDTGIGISRENIKKLFHKFSQADESTSRRFGGTGLGLSICRSLVDFMGGKIMVESTEGKGSTFIFSLPFSIATQEEATSQEAFKGAIEVPKGLNVLLVDDNSLNIKVAERFLKKLDYTYDVATNGKEAVEAVENSSYDIVFMDCHMPVMDGYQATKTIIKNHGDTRPYIIALTASSLSEDVEKCQQAGMDGFLSKPITKAALHEALLEYAERVLSKKSA